MTLPEKFSLDDFYARKLTSIRVKLLFTEQLPVDDIFIGIFRKTADMVEILITLNSEIIW